MTAGLGDSGKGAIFRLRHRAEQAVLTSGGLGHFGHNDLVLGRHIAAPNDQRQIDRGQHGLDRLDCLFGGAILHVGMGADQAKIHQIGPQLLRAAGPLCRVRPNVAINLGQRLRPVGRRNVEHIQSDGRTNAAFLRRNSKGMPLWPPIVTVRPRVPPWAGVAPKVTLFTHPVHFSLASGMFMRTSPHVCVSAAHNISARLLTATSHGAAIGQCEYALARPRRYARPSRLEEHPAAAQPRARRFPR